MISAAPVSESDPDQLEVMREAAAGADGMSSCCLDNSALALETSTPLGASEMLCGLRRRAFYLREAIQ